MAFTIPNSGSAAHAAQAQVDSVDLAIMVAGSLGYGIVSGCAVAAQGSPNMTVAVASGVVQLGSRATVAGGNVTISAAHATLARFDLIRASSDGSIGVATGTPASAPVFPAIPGGSVVLAAVYVPAATGTITNALITDKRVIVSSDVSAFGGGREASVVANTGSSYQISLFAGNVFDLTVTGNVTFSLIGAVAGTACSATVVLRRDSNGSRTISWPGSVTWVGGAPSWETTPNAVAGAATLLTLDGGTSWLGFASAGAGGSGGGGEGEAPQVQKDVFTSSGTWTKPSWAKTCTFILVAGGAGGGSGRRGAQASPRAGGAGGAGGSRFETTLAAADLPASMFASVGAGGAGGAAVTTDDTSGASGEGGGNSSVSGGGVTFYARGSNGASGGGITTASSGTSFGNGGGGGNGGNPTGPTAGSNASSLTSLMAVGSGGGGGGSISTGDTGSSGGGGGVPAIFLAGHGSAGSGGNSATAGGNGAASPTGTYFGGLGGGGGGAAGSLIGGPGGDGGNGGFPGGGGGGGGASVNGNNSGKGGDGGAGVVVIISLG